MEWEQRDGNEKSTPHVILHTVLFLKSNIYNNCIYLMMHRGTINLHLYIFLYNVWKITYNIFSDCLWGMGIGIGNYFHLMHKYLLIFKENEQMLIKLKTVLNNRKRLSFLCFSQFLPKQAAVTSPGQQLLSMLLAHFLTYKLHIRTPDSSLPKCSTYQHSPSPHATFSLFFLTCWHCQAT
jgi:hypothetical protein